MMRPSLPRRLLREFWAGLGYYGCSVMGMTPKQFYNYVASDGEFPDELPATPALPSAAHPECLVPDEPLSEEASRLWTELNMGGWPTV
jgi:hypothetical protein